MADDTIPSSPTPDTPPPRTTGGNWRWEPPSPEELQALLPGYTIEKLLGRGGMGAVYRGIQTNLDRPVAIKILPPGVEKEDPSFAERFKNEAKLMAKLMHPGVVAVFDFGKTSAGQLFFVMEYVDGSDVHQMITAQGKLPPEHALAVTAHVCDALQAAHELGIVHRDIKPANVLINMKGQVKVADFGLAKIDDPGQHGMTKTGYTMGTPDFVAPEALMLGTAMDGRADLYAVGVMLYQMLTGNIPRGAFKPASVLVPGLDPRFDPIILKAMQHDRAERHQSAAELRCELDVILTVPLVQNNAPASAAIPVAQVAETPGQRSVAQKPTGKPPQPRSDAGTPARNSAPPAGKSARTTPEPSAKSKTPLFIGLAAAAAIGIGAFVMLGGQKEPSKVAAPPAATKSLPKPTKPEVGVQASAATVKPEQPAPAATSSKSSEPQFPVGKWVKVFTKAEDLPEELRQAGVKFENGWIRLGGVKRYFRLPSVLAGNYGIRLSLIRQAEVNDQTRGPAGISVRLQPGESNGYNALLTTTSFVCNRREQGKDTKLLSVLCPIIPKTGDEGTLELSAVGSRLIGRVGTEFVTNTTDARWARGSGMISGSEDIRDIEVINLDGLSEAEALKILGVDEKGNDLRGASLAGRAAGPPAAATGFASTNTSTSPAPANAALGGPSALPGSGSPAAPISNSKSIISNASPAAFPPGQWVKLFTKFEDLPENLRQPNSGLKWEDGWIRFPTGKSHRIYAANGLTNYGIRARFLRPIDANRTSVLMIRARHLPEIAGYLLSPLSGQLYAALRLEGETSQPKRFWTTSSPAISWPQKGEEYNLEWCCVGNKLITRLDEQFVKVATDDTYPSGPGYVTGNTDLRDIEVINLDGIPEAEALRLLGVDEKGNDLRALAAKQEEAKKAQAAQTSAIDAIPELKTLHEQLTKLTAERVTAPFEADVAKLNTGYLGGLDRKIGEMKQKGDLDAVLALEEEKRLINVGRVFNSSGAGENELKTRSTSMP
ncbi:MAG: protein kinase, partial [Prosthecobacter sp.]|uniref:serine/threonine protein kinase n=1 Tax=Prosthecobacter sp. TaxID=1965333 RepID=UPI0019F3D297